MCTKYILHLPTKNIPSADFEIVQKQTIIIIIIRKYHRHIELSLLLQLLSDLNHHKIAQIGLILQNCTDLWGFSSLSHSLQTIMIFVVCLKLSTMVVVQAAKTTPTSRCIHLFWQPIESIPVPYFAHFLGVKQFDLSNKARLIFVHRAACLVINYCHFKCSIFSH